MEAVKADKLLWRARQMLQNPAAAIHAIAQELLKEDAQTRLGTLQDDDEADAETLGIVDELERLSEKKPKKLRDGSESLQDTLQARARIQALQTILKKLESGGESVQEDPPLSIIFDRWRSERKPTDKTWREFDLSLRRFIEVNGDLAVRTIGKQHIRMYKQALLTMKPDRPRHGKETLSTASVVKLLLCLHAVLEWASAQGYADTNVAHGVVKVASASTKNGDQQEERRLPFTVEQVHTLCEKLPADSELYTVTLIAMYTGARLAEIAGLRQEDWREEEGVSFFDIRPHEGRNLKTKASRRRVPIHQELLRLGLTRDVLPFKDSNPVNVSKRFMRWLRSDEVGVSDPRLVFHSFRHSVKDALRRAQVPEEVQRALLGHAGQGVAAGYGVGFPLSVLRDAVNRIAY